MRLAHGSIFLEMCSREVSVFRTEYPYGLVCRLHQEEEREKEMQPAGYIGQCTCSLTGLMIDVGRAVLAFLFSFFCTEEGMLEQSNQASSFCGCCLRRKTSENLFLPAHELILCAPFLLFVSFKK